MRLTDIKRAINNEMRLTFPDYAFYSPEIQEGFIRPCFFIELLPVTRDNEGSGLYSRRVSVIISYFSKGRTDLENLKMQYELERLFSQALAVGDRVIPIDGTQGYVTDRVLHFSFNLDYLDSIDETEQLGHDPDVELMQELNLKEVKDNGTSGNFN